MRLFGIITVFVTLDTQVVAAVCGTVKFKALVRCITLQLHDYDMCVAKNEEALRLEPRFAECYGNMANAFKVIKYNVETCLEPLNSLNCYLNCF